MYYTGFVGSRLRNKSSKFNKISSVLDKIMLKKFSGFVFFVDNVECLFVSSYVRVIHFLHSGGYNDRKSERIDITSGNNDNVGGNDNN